MPSLRAVWRASPRTEGELGLEKCGNAAMRRLPPVAVELRTDADCHHAVVELGDRVMREGQPSKEEQPLDSGQAFSAASMTASDLAELEVPTHERRK